MPDQVAELVKRGRALAPEDRERLVDQLLESLNEPATAELDAAWEAEIERRLVQYHRGEVQAGGRARVAEGNCLLLEDPYRHRHSLPSCSCSGSATSLLVARRPTRKPAAFW